MPGTGQGKTYLFKAITFLAVFLGIAIQIQTSILTGDDYKGIRINLADMILPLAGISILTSLILNRSKWPSWSVPLCYGFLAVLTGIMTFALICGYHSNGEWTTWALINKYTGWFILLSYFALGGWLSTNHNKCFLPVFTKSFVYCACILAFFFTIKAYLPHVIWDEWHNLYKTQIEGLSGNRNAFAFIFFTALCIASLIRRDTAQFLIPPYITIALWALSPFFILYNGSRAGFILILLLLLSLTVVNFRFFAGRIIPVILLSCVLITVSIGDDVRNIVIKQQKERSEAIVKLTNTPIDDMTDLDRKTKARTSEYMRFRVFYDAVDLWKTSPMMGAGLGTFLHNQYEKYDSKNTIVDIIDSTPLWLLTETGIIGLLCFLTFYIMALYSLWRYKRQNHDTLHGQFTGAVIIIMIGFGLMSLLHELLYTRFLWLFMGLALGLTSDQKASSRIKAATADRSPISET